MRTPVRTRRRNFPISSHDSLSAMKKTLFLLAAFVWSALLAHAAEPPLNEGALPAGQFVNPIAEGADPWVVRDPKLGRYLWRLSERMDKAQETGFHRKRDDLWGRSFLHRRNPPWLGVVACVSRQARPSSRLAARHLRAANAFQ